MAKDLEQRQERQEAYVYKAKKVPTTARDTKLAAQMKLKAAVLDAKNAQEDLQHAWHFSARGSR
eukprot:5582982-Pyramimonas_sp.AAC.1